MHFSRRLRYFLLEFCPRRKCESPNGVGGVVRLSLRALISENGILRNLYLKRGESLRLSLRRLRFYINTPKLPLRRPDFRQIYYLTTI